VKEEQIVAKALQMNGDVVVIPNLGRVITGTQDALTSFQRTLATLLGTSAVLGAQGLAYLLFALSVLAYAVDWYLESDSIKRNRADSRSRDTGLDSRLLMAVFAAAVVLAATGAMTIPSGPQEFGFDSVEDPSRGGIEAGTSEGVNFTLRNGAVLPMVSYLGADDSNIAVEPSRVVVPPRSQANATVTLTAPEEPGSYRRYVTTHRYLAILPTPVISWLHGVHPWLPVIVIDAMLAGAFYGGGIALVGRGRIRSRSRSDASGGLLG
jgi:signal peptidase